MSKTKTYWKGYSEKHKTPDFVNSSNKEFQDNVPVGEFLSSDEATDMKSGRRDFLKFMGFSVAAASLASCEAAVIKSIPYVNKPEEITPGVANWYSSTYYDGNDFANILVKSREGRPIWLKGKRDGITQGGLVPRISTSILNLYNSSRLEGPISNKNQVSWSEIDKKISKKLTEISQRNGKIRILSNSIISPSTQSVINDFISNYSNSESDVKHVQYDAQSYSGIRTANERNFGKAFIPSYKFDKSKAIVSINADFICNWLLPTKYSTDFSKTRKPENGWMSKHFHFESVLSLTGANADYRGQIKPSEELSVANAILNLIDGKQISESFNQDTISKLKKAAEALKNNKGESLVVAGSNNPNVQLVVNKINYQLNNYDKTIDINNTLELHKANDQEVEDFKNELLNGDIDGVIFYGTNPVYSHPEGKAIAQAISSLNLSVSFSEFMDETASNCQFICPDHNYLEAWCDHNPVTGHYSIQQPLIRPLYNSRQAQESFLVWSGDASRTNSESEVFYNYVKKHWESNNIGNQSDYLDFSDFWNWTIHNGFSESKHDLVSDGFTFTDVPVSDNFNQTAQEWEFILYQKELGVGHHAANPWLQELPDSISKIVWDNYITMAPSDCYKVFGIDSSDQKSAWDGIHLGQEEKAFVALIKVNDKEMKLPVYPLPGQKSGTVGISLGYGRGENNEDIGKAAYQCDEFGSHLDNGNGGLVPIGANAFRLCSFDNGYMSYNGSGEILATDERYALAGTQTHHTVMGRTSIVKETTFDFWKDNHEHNQ
jgi:molybdopterin-containing oxidoreductase family iron-sulfur binding subunit